MINRTCNSPVNGSCAGSCIVIGECVSLYEIWELCVNVIGHFLYFLCRRRTCAAIRHVKEQNNGFAGIKIGKQIKYADGRGIPFVALLGDDEIKAGTVTVKNLAAQTQQTYPQSAAGAAIRKDMTQRG